MIGVICYLQKIILFWQLLQLFTSLQLFGHVRVFLAIIVGLMWGHEEKTFQTTQNKVAKLQKIALSRTRSHMIS